jgi:regulator of RNase E activity RraA
LADIPITLHGDTVSNGFRVLPRVPGDPALVELFRDLPVANISDTLHRMSGALGLEPRHRGGYLLGTALTVKVRPGDNLMIHRALQLGQPGDVLVIDGGGVVERALIGEIMKRVAQARGFAGYVIDGAIRDAQAFADDDFPCYSRGITHRGPYKDGPGEINVPVSIGGAVVHPGDIVAGDRDGVVFIPPADAREIAAATRKKGSDEIATMASIANGTYDDAWVQEFLASKGLR